MANIINSKTTGTGGIEITSVDTTGVLNIQSGGTTAVTVDASGDVGVGITPNTWSLGKAVEINSGGNALWSAGPADIRLNAGAYYNGAYKYGNTGSLAATYEIGGGTHIWRTAPSGTINNTITFTQAMTLDSSGNLGLGVTPSAWASNYKALQIGAGGSFSTGSSAITYASIGANYFDNGASRYIGTGAATLYAQNAGQHIFYTAPSGTAGNAITFTQAMTLDASGYLMLNTTGLSGARGYFEIQGDSASVRNLLSTNNTAAGTGSNAFVAFSRNGTYTGGISQTGTTSAFVTSSDYRLKDNVAPMVGALDKVALLKPVTYTWKLDGSVGQGFIAHELQEVVPDAVTGEKDAVNEDGSIKSQGIDASYLVATLTAAIQEQQALIENLTSRIAVLEAK